MTFLEPAETRRGPEYDAFAVASLVAALTAPLTVLGFPASVVLAHFARRRMRASGLRGRRLTTAALWIGYGVPVLAAAALVVLYVLSWAMLPEPQLR